jgi:hypothetical protein
MDMLKVPRKAVEAIVLYLYKDERKNYLECECPLEHIFLSVQVLKEALDEH